MESANNLDNKKKNKIPKIFLITFVALLIITFCILLIVYVSLHKDDTRTAYTQKGISNEEILNKSFVEGFKATKDFGKYTYKISDEDLKELVYNGFNATKDKLPKKVENITMETNGNKQIYHIDLSLPIVKSRINIETELKYFDKLERYGYNINYMHLGKLDVASSLLNKGYFTNEICDIFFTNSCLPFKANLDEGMLEIDYTNLINKMPSGEIVNLLKNFMLNNKEYMGFSSDFIGFQIDFTNLRSDNFNAKNKSVGEATNIYEKVKNNFTKDKLTPLTTGETTTLTHISFDELNASFTHSLKTNVVEEKYTSSLTNQIAIIKVDKLILNPLSTKEVRIDSFISINGFLVDLSFNANVTNDTTPNNFVIGFQFNDTKGIYLGNTKVDANGLVKHIVINSITSLNFVSYQDPIKTLKVTFKSVIDNSKIIGVDAFDFNSILNTDGIDLTATRI